MALEAHNAMVAPGILSITTGINLKNTGATTLYTNATGKKVVITQIIVRVTAASVYTVAAQVSVGQNSATYNDILANVILNSLAVDAIDILTPAVANLAVAPAPAIKLIVNPGATATTATGSVVLIGFL